ncbi:MAG: UpxY family transcription antiterminator [Rikenellaceae bacterium]
MVVYLDHGVVWYAMKTIYRKELKAKGYFDSQGIENFIPMQRISEQKRGVTKETLQPAIHNLIFVKTDLGGLNEIKTNLNYIRNILVTQDGGQSVPVVVPTEQMEQFIDATTNHIDDITYVDMSCGELEKGAPVKIIGGEFEGYVGELERVKGSRDKVVHVILKGVGAYKFKTSACYIEKL